MKMEKMLARGLSVLFVLALVSVTVSNLNLSVISDEVFSLQLTRHSWMEMIRLACEDVHPPLYYLILKLAVDLFGGGDPYQTVYVGKMVGVLPFYLLFFFAWRVLRRHYGKLTASLFSCFLIGLPSIIHVGTLIRMYSWGLLFVTLAGVYAAFLLEGNESRRNWIGFILSCIAASYTHYFCGMAVFCIYCSAGIWALVKKRNMVRHLLLSAVCVAAAFLPWAAVLAGQVRTVSENYWIPGITPAVVLDYCKFYFAPYTDSKGIYCTLAILLAAVVIGACFRLLRKGGNHTIACLMLLNEVEVVLLGIAASLIVRPVFVARYAIPASGLFCLGLAICAADWISSDLSRKLGIAAICICGMISVIDVLSFIKNEYRYRENFSYLRANVLNSIQRECAAYMDSDDQNTPVVITDSAHLQGAFSWFLPGVTVYGEGFEVTEYARRMALPGIIDCWNAGTELSHSAECDVWIIHDCSKSDQWLENFPISMADEKSTALEQIEMIVYSIRNEGGK